jgi:hypothetical protein
MLAKYGRGIEPRPAHQPSIDPELFTRACGVRGFSYESGNPDGTVLTKALIGQRHHVLLDLDPAIIGHSMPGPDGDVLLGVTIYTFQCFSAAVVITRRHTGSAGMGSYIISAARGRPLVQ